MLILSLHAAGHDSAAALFRDYDLLAAVQQERLTRRKGDGGLPIAAMDDVLAIAGAGRADVAALVLTRAHYPAQFFRLGAYKNVESRINLMFGKHRNKDVAAEAGRASGRALDIFDGPGFAASLGLRPGIPIYFNNHHLAHGLSALFHTDWDSALVYTADGGGDNVHYSHRVLGGGKLDCLFGDDRWLAPRRRVDSLGLAYGYATQALGYRMNRHEGKLTGLAGFGKPVRADAIRRHFTVGEDGLVSSDFASQAATTTCPSPVLFSTSRSRPLSQTSMRSSCVQTSGCCMVSPCRQRMFIPHSIDDASSINAGSPVVAQNWQDLRAEEGNSASTYAIRSLAVFSTSCPLAATSRI